MFICLKTYSYFAEKLNGNHQQFEIALARIRSFLFDYIFSSSLLFDYFGQPQQQHYDLARVFEIYLNSSILESSSSATDLLSSLLRELNAKLAEMIRQTEEKEKVKLNGEKIKIKSYAQACMYNFEKVVNLKSLSSSSENSAINVAFVTYSNLNLRVRHLLYLLALLFDKVIIYVYVYANAILKCNQDRHISHFLRKRKLEKIGKL